MAKKDKSPKMPKKVGGVKVPKQLRKTAKSALEIAQNPIARELVSAALVAGAAALTKKKAAEPAPAPAQPEAKQPDFGSLIREGVAAFVSGFDKGAELMKDTMPAKPKPKAPPKPKA